MAGEKTAREVVGTRLVQPNFFFVFEGAMYTLKRKHDTTDQAALKDGWVVGEWEGAAVRFFPSLRHGQPAVTAHGLAQALWRELATFGPTPPKALYFSKRKLLAATGKTWSKANRDVGMTALKQIADCYLEFETLDPKTNRKRYATVRLLQEINVEVDETSGGTESVVLTLSDFAHDCLQNKDVLLFNWDRLAELGNDPIAINLAKYFTARGNKLMDRNTGKPTFSAKKGYSKDYHAVCDQYLGGLTHRKTKSEIERQLGRAFASIHRARFGAMYVKKSNSTTSGYVIAFKPLDGFYNDYESLLRSPRRRSPQQSKVHQNNNDQSAPVLLASYFHRQLGRNSDHILLKREVSYLKGLLKTYTYSEIEQWIEHVAKTCKRNGRVPERVNVLSSWEQAWNTHRARREETSAITEDISTCRLCDKNGNVQLLREDQTPIVHRCPHDASKLLKVATEKGMSVPSHLA